MHHFIPLINKPTREVNNSKTKIDNIFCNVPLPFNMCDVGILCPYITDHHAIFCILKTHKSQSLSLLLNITYARFIRNLQRETWDLVYTQGTQKGFTWFQRSVNLLFDKCFNKQTYPIT